MLRSNLGSFVLLYFKFLAKLKLLLERPLVVGIAGSSGKTSLSLLLGNILSQKYKIKQSSGRNSETGIPLSVLGLDVSNYSYIDWLSLMLKAPFKVLLGAKSDVFIAEMGIDAPVSPKNMDYLLSVLKPDIAAITNITYEHSVYFEKYIKGSEDRAKRILDSIANEELKLLRSLTTERTAVVNIDDKFIKNSLPLEAKVVTISAKDSKADYFIKSAHARLGGFEVLFINKKSTYTLRINQGLPRHFAYTFVEAAAVASSLGISLNSVVESIENNFSLPPGRATFFKGIKRSTIIDSTYNNVASEPLIGFLELMNEIAESRRKVGILGDMREQGEIAKLEHEKVAQSIVKNLDFAILIGESMKKFVAPILKSMNFPYLSFSTFTQAKEDILKGIRQRDLILVKGSQNQLFLERVVEMLLEKSQDSEKLARRGEYWDKIRRKSP